MLRQHVKFVVASILNKIEHRIHTGEHKRVYTRCSIILVEYIYVDSFVTPFVVHAYVFLA